MSEKYKSQGTVRCYVGETDVHIYFVPHSDYMVTHGDEHYAVFLTDDGSKCTLGLCDKDDHGKPVGTKIDILEYDTIDKTVERSDLSKILASAGARLLISAGAQSAAMANSKVEVEVEEDGGELKLTGITVPVK